jgi:hypothetical protein
LQIYRWVGKEREGREVGRDGEKESVRKGRGWVGTRIGWVDDGRGEE